MQHSLIFDIDLGRTKPNSLRGKKDACPFCDTAHLTDILAQEGHIIWLLNKYPVLKNTWPTVIIETNRCHDEFSQYPLDEATRVLSFSIDKWEETLQRSEFKSVIYLKNHGPMSGGSLRHPHSQIIGLRDYDYRKDIKEVHFEGWELHNEDDLQITLSNHPIIGFFEFNFIIAKDVNRKRLTLRLQQTVKYILKAFSYSASYNIFFYDLNTNNYYIKVVPRYVTTPIYVGYCISQVCNEKRALEIRDELNSFYTK